MTPKLKLFLDFDQTIVNAVEAYCETYNEMYGHCEGFVPADWTQVKRWDLKDQCPMHDKPEEIFDSSIFFRHLSPINDNTIEILDMIKEFCHITICTIGRPDNIIKKTKWIEENLDIKDMVLLCQDEITMDKSVVNMEGAIFVDDNEKNLYSSNALTKICFGTTEWNKSWNDGHRVANWMHLHDLLKDYYHELVTMAVIRGSL